MLVKVCVEDLKENDRLYGGKNGQPDEFPEEMKNTRLFIAEAYAIPTRKPRQFELACRVARPVKVGRLYVSVPMGTYAVVRRLKGTVLVVDRPEQNGPEDDAPAVVEASEPDLLDYFDASTIDVGTSYRSERDEYADKPADFVDEGGAAYRSKPFNYVRRQFDYVEDDSEFYRIQIRSDTREARTKWMNITPAQFRVIREVLVEGES